MIASLTCIALALLPAANAQMMSGQITGRLADPAGAVIVGAKVQITNDLTKQVREFTTDSNGNFTFTNVPPATYTLKVAQTGFKTYEQKAITVGAVERVALPEIVLQVGDVSTSVEVTASAVRVNTDSSDRGTAITTTQITDTVTKGRNFMMLMATLPGVQDLNQTSDRGWGTSSPTLMGGQSGQKLLVLDGAASQDSGNRDFGYIAPSVDAISEVKVLVANFNAEYGARSGG
ncbi:MAG TPA: carboxypeptidase-like regulatory domain-containing protein, partial [Bryobacteraceae bacterium]|nr:carboxypeptidase-like regulatory domain-containing protein [Bryobacteraceae bacterium]